MGQAAMERQLHEQGSQDDSQGTGNDNEGGGNWKRKRGEDDDEEGEHDDDVLPNLLGNNSNNPNSNNTNSKPKASSSSSTTKTTVAAPKPKPVVSKSRTTITVLSPTKGGEKVRVHVNWNPAYIFQDDPINLSEHPLTDDEELWIAQQIVNNVITERALAMRLHLSQKKVTEIYKRVKLAKSLTPQKVEKVKKGAATAAKAAAAIAAAAPAPAPPLIALLMGEQDQELEQELGDAEFGGAEDEEDDEAKINFVEKPAKKPKRLETNFSFDDVDSIEWVGGMDRSFFSIDDEGNHIKVHSRNLSIPQKKWLADQLISGVISVANLSGLLGITQHTLNSYRTKKEQNKSFVAQIK